VIRDGALLVVPVLCLVTCRVGVDAVGDSLRMTETGNRRRKPKTMANG